jgi:hypothetical protein
MIHFLILRKPFFEFTRKARKDENVLNEKGLVILLNNLDADYYYNVNTLSSWCNEMS